MRRVFERYAINRNTALRNHHFNVAARSDAGARQFLGDALWLCPIRRKRDRRWRSAARAGCQGLPRFAATRLACITIGELLARLLARCLAPLITDRCRDFFRTALAHQRVALGEAFRKLRALFAFGNFTRCIQRFFWRIRIARRGFTKRLAHTLGPCGTLAVLLAPRPGRPVAVVAFEARTFAAVPVKGFARSCGFVGPVAVFPAWPGRPVAVVALEAWWSTAVTVERLACARRLVGPVALFAAWPGWSVIAFPARTIGPFAIFALETWTFAAIPVKGFARRCRLERPVAVLPARPGRPVAIWSVVSGALPPLGPATPWRARAFGS